MVSDIYIGLDKTTEMKEGIELRKKFGEIIESNDEENKESSEDNQSEGKMGDDKNSYDAPSLKLENVLGASKDDSDFYDEEFTPGNTPLETTPPDQLIIGNLEDDQYHLGKYFLTPCYGVIGAAFFGKLRFSSQECSILTRYYGRLKIILWKRGYRLLKIK